MSHSTTPTYTKGSDFPHGLHIFTDINSKKTTKCSVCNVRQIAMCSRLSSDEVNHLNTLANNYKRSAKQTLCIEGDAATSLFNIKTGIVRLSKMLPDGRRQITGFLFPGDFFGLAGRNNYTYSAEAITDVTICALPRPKITELFTEMPHLGERILEMTQEDLELSHEQMLLLGRKNALEKLSTFLLSIHKKSSRVEGITEHIIYIPMKRADIADYLGLTIETISRKFTKLTKDGLIRLIDPHHLYVNDMDALTNLSQGL